MLGFEFLNHFNPSIDWRQGLITFNADHKDYNDPSNSSSTEFSSAKSCAALRSSLQGDSRFWRRKFCNFTSSLLWNMDLPPSSHHDSLDELWDEEEMPEEIKITMKVFPSVCHQYLDLFSKVKAGRLPPHPSCDHHIELQGSLLQGFHDCSNHSLTNIVETDSSDFALAAVLSQVSDSGKHPILFDIFKLLPAETKSEIHDKELLGIVWDLKH
ncbi:hypothetical protein O181_011246 [Austropuccinia psidii MF-1]|uniref:Reverse transcriptase/retrotransposon-derived protein RNase H-like domain-containing protein n=1 Tax=Austropuccinia psidii MF-1 TaxID=1389203 RepID=A0A9Q3BVE7_9BASI|nr:hypothetical protein [Austropuccinia psidii MF-1]